ncbi:WAT1-related protein At3g28050 [Sesamum indicum]|uniref:WAT1-related protein n=1 Tax=Sesamum indicum TaxID=4182 RepID=A0A6I9TL41_SESIN|nr:WAT1-related protein At3g28050 [Sesamum indicum]
MATRQWPWIQSSLPFIGMVSAVVALAINMIISKMAMSKGISFYILSVYSNGFATLILFPTAFLFHGSKRPPLSFPVLWRICLLASFGCFAEIGSYAGINYSSPTLSTAMLNLVPAFTYILAIIFRMEEVHLRKLSTISKVFGTLVSISGAFIVTFYKGPAIIGAITSGSSTQLHLPQTQNWVLGGFLLACASFMTASWCILQASILKMYRAEMIVVAFYCCFVTIQSSLVSLIAERDLTAWRIETKIGLIAVFYSAIINIAYRLYVTAWCLWRTGPLFVALFKPLTIVIAVVIGVIFMKDILYLGSLIGALVLIIGFYAVMWGKAKEGELNKGTEASSYEAPLLQENVEEP